MTSTQRRAIFNLKEAQVSLKIAKLELEGAALSGANSRRLINDLLVLMNEVGSEIKLITDLATVDAEAS